MEKDPETGQIFSRVVGKRQRRPARSFAAGAMPGVPNWSFLETFSVHQLAVLGMRSWRPIDEWLQSSRSLLDAMIECRADLLARWDRLLGKDPTSVDWERFRPLRLSREEDWSDWLAHLLETDPDGHFPRGLFGRFGWKVGAFHPVRADREDRAVDGSRRADLVLRWPIGNVITQVEVKLEDTNYEKTPDTGEKVRLKAGADICHDVLLLPDEERLPSDVRAKVAVLMWRDVAVALRRSVRNSREVTWRTWAAALAGAIEQKILNFPRSFSIPGLHQLAELAEQIRLLQEALNDDDDR